MNITSGFLQILNEFSPHISAEVLYACQTARPSEMSLLNISSCPDVRALGFTQKAMQLFGTGFSRRKLAVFTEFSLGAV